MPLITSKIELEALVAEARKAPFMAFDTETTGAGKDGLNWNRGKMIGISFCFDGVNGYYVKGDLWPVVGKALGDPKLAKGAHNAKFDLHFLREAGVRVAGTVYDTEVLARVNDENHPNYKLKDLCARIFKDDSKDTQTDLKDWMKANGVDDYGSVPPEILIPYACKDAVLVHRLFHHQKSEILAKDGADGGRSLATLWSVVEREAKITRIVEQMERVGHAVDLNFLNGYKSTLAAQQEEARAKVFAIAGHEFNPNSDEQVSEEMLKLGWLPKEKTKTGANKTDRYALEDWEHPFSEAMLEYRRCGKLISTYCEGIVERAENVVDGRGVLHPDYRTNGAATGRFSCTNPNLQNTDKKSESRRAFIVRPGYTNFYLDFKQIEICGFAYYANDMLMQDALWRGEDFHLMNAVAIFDKPADQITKEEREKAKTFNFALLYGAGEARIAKMLKVTMAESKMFKLRYMAKFPSVKKLRFKCEDAIRGRGYVCNRFGRRCNLAAEDCYKAMNRLIQSWAADLLKEAMTRVAPALAPYAADLLLQIHDELVIQIKDGPEQMKILKVAVDAMTAVGEMVKSVPIRVDVKSTKTNWHDRKELSHEDMLAVCGGVV